MDEEKKEEKKNYSDIDSNLFKNWGNISNLFKDSGLTLWKYKSISEDFIMINNFWKLFSSNFNYNIEFQNICGNIGHKAYVFLRKYSNNSTENYTLPKKICFIIIMIYILLEMDYINKNLDYRKEFESHVSDYIMLFFTNKQENKIHDDLIKYFVIQFKPELKLMELFVSMIDDVHFKLLNTYRWEIMDLVEIVHASSDDKTVKYETTVYDAIESYFDTLTISNDTFKWEMCSLNRFIFEMELTADFYTKIQRNTVNYMMVVFLHIWTHIIMVS